MNLIYSDKIMKKEFLIIFVLLSLTICQEETNYIIFMNNMIKIPDGGGAFISGTAVVIEKPGIYYVSGQSEEGNIVVKSSSVDLYLQNLELTSKTTAPIIVTSNLDDVKIINLQKTTLNDFENSLTTEGECAVVKIKKKSSVYFENNDVLTLNGLCDNIIKGGSQASIVFKKSSGEYIINSNKTGIASDGSLEFNGGKFTIVSDHGDGIKSVPDKDDIDSLGKILINDGNFNIHSFNDAITAKNNITVVKGKFEIKTENGYESTTFNENESSKGFKLNNNETGCGITIYSGEFSLNTADDAFHSKGDIKLLSGKYIINAGDDGLSAKLNLVLGTKDASNEDLDLKILKSYEALEGMAITIYSGKIIATATDDGINASGEHQERGGGGRHNNGTKPSDSNRTKPERNKTREDQGEGGRHNNHTRQSDSNRTKPERNKSRDDQGEGGQGASRMRGNASFYVSIYDAEIYIFCDGDGIDSNGNIFIHGGNINIFSQGNKDNEPIDHEGNFSLFNGEVLGVGAKGMEYIHSGIKKGNQMYAYHAGDITKNKLLEIRNENDEVVKEGAITKDINYIFYTSSKLNEKYHFYIYDQDTSEKNELEVTFNSPEKGEDNEKF